MSNLVGQTIGGRYRVDRVVARGGMATVYLAHDLRLERNVALKVIHPHLAGDASFREKFIREAKIAAKLSHPNLVNVFDQGEEGDIAYLAMEYVSGITLRDALKDFGALDGLRALELFEPMLAGLAAAHRAGILHRDLKPENVLLADDGRIKLGDFGLARDVDNHTGTGSLVGTVAYLSPELVMRGTADARSDVYAAGIMLFEMLAGRQPFQGEQAVQIAYQHANDNVPAPSQFNPQVPPLLDELVLWATARDAAHRPADAVELFAVVQRARQDLKSGKATAHLTKTVPLPNLDVSTSNKTTVMPAFDQDTNASVDATAVLDAFSGQSMASDELAGTQILDDLNLDSADDSVLDRLARSKRGLKLFVATLLVVLLGSGTGWWFSSGPGGLAAIPNLTSRTVDEAQVTLGKLHANIKIAEESSATVTKGLVIRTDPSAGSWYFGGSITIYVSSGPKLIAAPSLKGLNLVEATAAIAKAGFQLGDVKSFFNTAPIGQVFDYLGLGGSAIPEGSKIDLSISLGSIPVVAGLSQEAAVTAIEAVGLKIENIIEDFSDTVAAGQVISLVPLSEPLGEAGTVNLVVSKGPNTVVMPNLIGETVLAAKTALENLGLKVVVNTNQLTSRWGVVTVKRQSAAAGAQLHVGDSVTISTR